jgi:hypothetical protein
MKKVRIKKLPTAQSGLEVKMGTSGRGMIAGLGLNSNTMPWPVMAGQMAQPNIEVNKTLKPVAREGANLEAEKGETAFTDLVGDGIPQMYKIAGERHYNGGTPLNLPEDSFIFSRDNKMKIGGPILESFGKHKDTKDKFTPADLSSKYDINEYRKILADPDSDKLQRATAELMIANYNLKLGKLGLVQESKKGFPDGIPAISMPYIETMQVDPNQFFQNPQAQGPQGMPDQPDADNVARYGGLMKAQTGKTVKQKAPSIDDLYNAQQQLLPFVAKSKKSADLYNKLEAQIKVRKNKGETISGTKSKSTEPMGWYDAEGNRIDTPSQGSKGYWDRPSDWANESWLQKGIDPSTIKGTVPTAANEKTREALSKVAHPSEAEGVFDYLGNALTIPQKGVNLAITGNYEAPGTTYLRTHPGEEGMAMAIDIAADPLNLIGVGEIYKGAKATVPVIKKGVEAVKFAGQALGPLAGYSFAKIQDFAIKHAPEVAAYLKKYGKGALESPYVQNVLARTAVHVFGTDTESKSEISYQQRKAKEQGAVGFPSYVPNPAQNAYLPSMPMTPSAPAINQELPDPNAGFSTSDLMNFEEPEIDTTNVIKDMWDEKRFGGSLDKYQRGGFKEKIDSETKIRSRKYEDGTITVFDSKGIERVDTKGDPNWKPTTTTPTKTSTPVKNPLATGKEPYSMLEAYGPKGVERLNPFLEEYGLPELSPNATKAEIQKAVGDMQAKTIEANPDLVSHYMQNAVEPNNKLRAILKEKKYPQTKAGLQQALKDGKLTPEEIRGGYKDDQWWHRAVGTNQKVLSKADYEKMLKNPNVIKQGERIFTVEDPTHPELYTEYITDNSTPGVEDAPEGDDPIVKAPVGPAYKTPGPEWWLQDKIKVAGAFGDLMRIKKYNPWMATPGLALPEGTFYDPTRELAANAEQVNLGVQGASTYSGPQSFAATAAALQGQGAANAANIMGRYNNLNVTESNRLGDSTNAVLNYASQQRAGNATQLFDKQTIVNQQFDNSKAMARQNLRQGFMDAITNRANTYNLNTLYPQFAVGPGNGGMIYNIPGSNRELNSNYKGQETPEEYLNRVHNMEGYDIDEKKWLRDQYPGASKSTASNQGYSDEELARIKAMRGYT